MKLTSRELIDLAAEAGFGGVDFLMRDLLAERGDPRDTKARLDDRGLRAGAWSLPVDWRGDAHEFARDLEQLPRYAAAAAILGAVRTGTWVMPETRGPADPEAGHPSVLDATVAMHLQRLGAIARPGRSRDPARPGGHRRRVLPLGTRGSLRHSPG